MRKDTPLAPFFSHHFLILEEIWLVGEGVITSIVSAILEGFFHCRVASKPSMPHPTEVTGNDVWLSARFVSTAMLQSHSGLPSFL